jgi:hypothetical protein
MVQNTKWKIDLEHSNITDDDDDDDEMLTPTYYMRRTCLDDDEAFRMSYKMVCDLYAQSMECITQTDCLHYGSCQEGACAHYHSEDHNFLQVALNDRVWHQINATIYVCKPRKTGLGKRIQYLINTREKAVWWTENTPATGDEWSSPLRVNFPPLVDIACTIIATVSSFHMATTEMMLPFSWCLPICKGHLDGRRICLITGEILPQCKSPNTVEGHRHLEIIPITTYPSVSNIFLLV